VNLSNKNSDRLNCVLLFDIDGTLVTRTTPGASAGLKAMNHAAQELTGIAGLADKIKFAGATDLGVARKLFLFGGVENPTREMLVALLDSYVKHLDVTIKTDSYSPLGNPKQVIPLLKSKGAIIGLGTGNVKEGAAHKLKSADIFDLFDIEKGGYGDDAEIRSELIKIAIHRCDPSGSLPAIVIGDTQKDINAAKEADCLSIGVPCESSTKEMLLAAGADKICTAVDITLYDIVKSLIH